MSSGSSRSKLVDNIFSDAPYNVLTSDEGLRLKYLRDIRDDLDQHNDMTRRALQAPGTTSFASPRTPEYLPAPEINIDTSALADAQFEVADKLGDVLDSQRKLIEATSTHTPLFKQMIRNQGVESLLQYKGNQLLTEANVLGSQANEIAVQAAVAAYQQRNDLTQRLSETLVNTGMSIEATISDEAKATRVLLHQLLTDIGSKIVDMTNEQVVTRIAVLQTLYSFQSTYIQTHEQAMLSQQRQQGLLQQILHATRMTEGEHEADRLWRRAELARSQAQSRDEFKAALALLQQAYSMDDMNPQICLSLGTIHSTLGHPDLASIALVQADQLIEHAPNMTSYTLMNLANNLMLMGRHEHAESVMRKATKIDPRNREVWFQYAKIAWKVGKKNEAMQCLTMLLKANLPYYKAQILIDPDLEELRQLLSTPSKT